MTSNKFYGKVITRGKQKVKGGNIMAVKVTNKKPLSGNRRSHALNATKRKQNFKKIEILFKYSFLKINQSTNSSYFFK